MSTQDRPVVCVSYLAAAELWSVTKFPTANQGAVIRSTDNSIAADGPMAAAVLAALGVPTLLVSNRIGSDEAGGQVGRWLRQHAVPTVAVASGEIATPRIVVVADGTHSRTWFAFLPGVEEDLGELDLSSVMTASIVYLDAYRLIEATAIRVIRAARPVNARLFVNIGGEALTEALRTELAGCRNLLLQTNIDDDDHRNAPAVAENLLRETCADWVIVTTGAHGAVAASCAELVTTSAFPVEVRHTHCAGAAFSGGVIYGLRAGMPMANSLVLGCASGALRCSRPQNAPLPSLLELESLMSSFARNATR